MTRTCITCHTPTDATPCPQCGGGTFRREHRPQTPLEAPDPSQKTYDCHVHANEVRVCLACHQRVAWVETAYGKHVLLNVPDTERLKSYQGVDTKSWHNCAHKERLALIKGSKTRRV